MLAAEVADTQYYNYLKHMNSTASSSCEDGMCVTKDRRVWLRRQKAVEVSVTVTQMPLGLVACKRVRCGVKERQ